MYIFTSEINKQSLRQISIPALSLDIRLLSALSYERSRFSSLEAGILVDRIPL